MEVKLSKGIPEYFRGRPHRYEITKIGKIFETLISHPKRSYKAFSASERETIRQYAKRHGKTLRSCGTEIWYDPGVES